MPSVLEMALAKLAEPDTPPPVPDPEKIRARIAANNQLTAAGLAGQLSEDQLMNNLGGKVFQKALSDRTQVKTSRGILDPMTEEFTADPEFVQQQEQGRKQRILEAALRYEDQRQRAEERSQRGAEQDQLRRDLAAGRNATSAGLTGLREDLLREQIEARRIANEEATRKAAATAENRQASVDRHARQLDTILTKVGEAEKMVGSFTTGAGAALSKSIPGLQYVTGIPDLEATIDTIKANLGFAQLEEMRKASPTGGALGQVTVKEIDFLQNTIASLDTRQNPRTLRNNLQQIRESMTRLKAAIDAAAAEASASPAATPIAAPSAAPTPGGTPPAAAPSPGRVRLIRGPDGKLMPAP